jgi:hypothetical protein
MSELSVLVSGIESKVRKLTGMLERFNAEGRQLQEERSLLRKKIEEQERQIRQLEEKNRNLHMVHALTSRDDAVSVRQKINELVRDIDRCISLLNK